MKSEKAIDLILDAEGCDLTPSWPGGASGLTIGIGYDCGYNSKEQIQRDWATYCNGNLLAVLLNSSGIKGESAKRLITPVTRTLRITKDAAIAVFENSTLPRFEKLALNTYPGLDQLPEDVQGAITSLVFNRGASLKGDSRREMAELVPLIESGDLQGIADTIRRMTRLWEGKGLHGLITRRNNEAGIIESSI